MSIYQSSMLDHKNKIEFFFDYDVLLILHRKKLQQKEKKNSYEIFIHYEEDCRFHFCHRFSP